MSDKAIPYLKADAVVTIGSKAVSDLQAILAYMCRDIDTTSLKQRMENKSELTDTERNCVTLMQLLAGIHKQAEANGMIIYKDVADIIPTSL